MARFIYACTIIINYNSRIQICSKLRKETCLHTTKFTHLHGVTATEYVYFLSQAQKISIFACGLICIKWTFSVVRQYVTCETHKESSIKYYGGN